LGDGKGQMKIEMLSAETPETIGDMTITPLVRQEVICFCIKDVLIFDVKKQPVYVVLTSNGHSKVLDMLGCEIPIHQAETEFPCLNVNPAGAGYPLREQQHY